jgi:hypothetical protein
MNWTKLDFALYYVYLQTACQAIGPPPQGIPMDDGNLLESDQENEQVMTPQPDSNLVVKGVEQQLSQPAPDFESFDSLGRHAVHKHWQECLTLQVRWCALLNLKAFMQTSS